MIEAPTVHARDMMLLFSEEPARDSGGKSRLGIAGTRENDIGPTRSKLSYTCPHTQLKYTHLYTDTYIHA